MDMKPLLLLLLASALLLIPAAIFVPHPGDLSEPKDAAEILQPKMLVTPEGGSYRFVGREDYQNFKPVYAVLFAKTVTQNITRKIGWEASGVSLGFFHRNANWKYQLAPPRFDQVSADGQTWMENSEIEKLLPLVVAELNKRESGRGARLEQMLTSGVRAESVICWQNLIVLAAWMSGVLVLLSLARRLLTRRTG